MRTERTGSLVIRRNSGRPPLIIRGIASVSSSKLLWLPAPCGRLDRIALHRPKDGSAFRLNADGNLVGVQPVFRPIGRRDVRETQ